MEYSIYNFKTEQYESVSPDSLQDWSDYIPQYPAAQNLYRLYREMGDSPTEAAMKVLTLVVKPRN